MHRRSPRAMALALCLLGGVSAAGLAVAPAFAQDRTPPERGAPDARDRADRHHRLSPEIRTRLFEGRLAMAKTALGIKPGEQEQLWAAFEKVLRDGYAARQKALADRAAAPPRDRRAAESPIDRLERRAAALETAAAHTKQVLAAAKPLYESFDDNQKSVARALLARAGNPHRHIQHRAHSQGPRHRGPDSRPDRGRERGPDRDSDAPRRP